MKKTTMKKTTMKKYDMNRDIELMLEDVKDLRKMVIASICFAVTIIPVLLLAAFLLYTQ